MNAANLHAGLKAAGVKTAAGLSLDECARIERRYGFVFPPDLREFLGHALPISPGWVNWRTRDRARIEARLASPLEGICYDIEHNAFWLETWGDKPAALTEQFAVAALAVRAAPVLIPIYGHRFMPSRPCERGNPVFSVHQTDIIYYGFDLEDYLANEFLNAFGRDAYRIEGRPREIEFWSEISG